MKTTTMVRGAYTRIFHLKEGEERVFGLLFAHSFFLGIFLSFQYVPASAVFIDTYGSHNLPYIYIAASIVGYGMATLFASLQAKFDTMKLFMWLQIFMLLLIVFQRAALEFAPAKELSFFVCIWSAPFQSMLNILSGGLALQLLNIRQSKRLFGLFNMGGITASIIGFFSIPLLSSWVGHLYNHFFFAMLGMVGACVMLVMIHRHIRSTHSVASKTERVENVSFKVLFKQRYTLLIFTTALFSGAVIYLTDFTYMSTLEQSGVADTPQKLSVFIAVVCAVYKAGELIGSYFTNRFLSRFGMRVAVNFLSHTLTIIMIVIIIAAFTTGSESWAFFVPIIIFQITERTFGKSIEEPVFNVLYQPLPDEQKIQVQTRVEMIMQFSFGLVGLLLLVINSFLHDSKGLMLEYFVLIFFVLLAVWIVITRSLFASYSKQLRYILSDKSKVKRTDNVKQVFASEIHAKNILNRHPQLSQWSSTIIHQAAPTVLNNKITSMFRNDNKAIFNTLANRPNALWSNKDINTLTEYTQQNQITDYDDMFAALRGQDVPNESYQKLWLVRDILNSSNINTALLKELLNDTDVHIRQAAISIVISKNIEELLPQVIHLLPNPDLTYTIAHELASVGEKILPRLEVLIIQYRSPQLLCIILEICAKISTRKAEAVILKYLNYPDAMVQAASINALHHCRFQAQGDQIAFVRNKLKNVASVLVWNFACIDEISNERNTLKLQQSLEYERNLAYEQLFALLSCLYEPNVINLIQKNLQGENFVFALEIVDNFIAADIKEWIVPLIDNLTPSGRVKALQSHFPQKRMSLNERLKNIITTDYDRTHVWTVTTALELMDKMHRNKQKTGIQTGTQRKDKLELWTNEKIKELLQQIRKSEIPDEVFACLYHPHELVYSAAAEIIYDESPERCDTFLRRMSGGEMHELIKQLEQAKNNDGVLPQQRLKMIKRHPLFIGIPENVLLHLLPVIKVRNLIIDEQVFLRYQTGDEYMVIIIKGKLRTEDNTQIFNAFDTIARGIETNNSVVKLRALTATTIFYINRGEYYNLLMQNTELVRYIGNNIMDKQSMRRRTSLLVKQEKQQKNQQEYVANAA